MKTKSLSKLEEEVMSIVWTLKKCSVRDALNKLSTEKKFAYTTVATLLHRLYEKGLVNRNDDNLIHSYSPKISKESYTKSVAKLLTNSFFKSYGDIAIASFAESIEKLPKQKREYFLKLLNRKNEVK